jgi:molybdopterin synthase catalytic subunit
MIRINVKLFAILRERTGVGEMSIEIPDGSTIAYAAEEIARQRPQIKELLPRVAFAVNQEYQPRESKLNNRDELALIPPVSGG